MISILVFKHRLENIFLNWVLKALLNLFSSFYQIQDSLVANLLRLIQKMKPKPKAEVKLKKEEEIDKETLKSDIEIKKKLFPGLAIADDPKIRVGWMCLFILNRISVWFFLEIDMKRKGEVFQRRKDFWAPLFIHVIKWLNVWKVDVLPY